jgi:hypothetical protein
MDSIGKGWVGLDWLGFVVDWIAMIQLDWIGFDSIELD